MAGRVSRPASWAVRRTDGAPEALRARVAEWLAGRPEGDLGAETLLEAGRDALRATTGQPGGRSVALDLLAADALVTLALLFAAEHDPAGLEGFARAARCGEGRPA